MNGAGLVVQQNSETYRPEVGTYHTCESNFTFRVSRYVQYTGLLIWSKSLDMEMFALIMDCSNCTGIKNHCNINELAVQTII